MKEGKLIDSETLMKFIKFSIQGSANKKILLDGFPRNKENLDCWNKNMGDVADVKGVLYFEVSDEEMKKRLLGRNEGRADDNEETIAKRLATFNNDTKPIIEFYEKQLRKGFAHYVKYLCIAQYVKFAQCKQLRTIQ